jgi:hypothetical protein
MKQALKICKGCLELKPIWSKGQCLSCSKTSFKKLSTKVNKKSPELKDFYISEIIANTQNPVSIESQQYIGALSGVNIAHIFPKESYKSVQTEPDNIVILTWEEHTRFDELLNVFNFSKLEVEFKNSWQIICQRVLKLLPLLEERGKLRSKFEEYLDYDSK